jgi:hypothetical protein
MPNASDSEHDLDKAAPEPERFGTSDESARTGNARAPDTPADASDWFDSLRDIHFTWSERGPAGESAGLPDNDWWRSLDGELHTEIDAEPTSDATAGSSESGEWWRTPDEQLAFARKSCTLPAESDGLTRAAEPAGDAGAAGLAGAERRRPGVWVLSGLATLAILVVGTASCVVVSRSEGSRPRGKVVSNPTTAPTTTSAPVATTATAPETSVPASPAPPAAPTAPRTTTTSRRAPAANPDPAVTAAPPPAPPPPPPDTTPAPPDTTPAPPGTTPVPLPST